MINQAFPNLVGFFIVLFNVRIGGHQEDVVIIFSRLYKARARARASDRARARAMVEVSIV